MSRERRAWIWFAVLVAALAILYTVSSVLLPFVAAMAVAYFLDPVADRLEAWGCSRLISTILITVAFFAFMLTVLIIIAPLLQNQILGLIRKLPDVIEVVTSWLAPLQQSLEASLTDARIQELKDASKNFTAEALRWMLRLLGGIWKGGVAVFNLLSLLLITPLVSFYLLRDWDRIVEKVDSWLPRSSAPTIRMIIVDIDKTIAGFVRGQGTVCLLLAVFYGIGLTLTGLEFGLLVGLGTGLISFVPYFGMLIGMSTGVALAVVQFGAVTPVVLVIGVFILGQLIESMFITPKLVGDQVGLHPVWVIFALMAGGAAFGFTGILLAVPVAVTIGVLIRFFLGEYMKSGLYDSARKASPPTSPDC